MKDMAIALETDASGRADVRFSSRIAKAYADLREGLGKSWLWMALANQDIKLRYRGSILGPLWLTVSTVVMIGAMGFLYAKLFHTELATYFPYLAIGLVVWQFVSTLINDGCTTFISVQGVIQQVRLPFSVHAYRLVYRNLIVLAHNFVVVPVVLAIFRPPIDWQVIWVLPALALLLCNGVWVSILLGMVSARFRDVPPIIGNFLQVLFFVTPIFWASDLLGNWEPVAQLNPLFAAIDIIRAPLIGAATAPHSWSVMLAVTILGGGATFLLFARFRGRIAFWV